MDTRKLFGMFPAAVVAVFNLEKKPPSGATPCTYIESRRQFCGCLVESA